MKVQDHEEFSVVPLVDVIHIDLATVPGVKDAAHYGTVFVSPTVLRSTLRATTRLVSSAEAAVQNSASS